MNNRLQLNMNNANLKAYTLIKACQSDILEAIDGISLIKKFCSGSSEFKKKYLYN